MDADLFTTTCPVQAEFERAVSALRDMGAAYQRIDPSPALARVAVPALVMSREVRASLQSEETGIVFSGWVEHRPAAISMPDGPAPEGDGLCFRRAAIMVLSPCVADETKIRLVAHVEGDLAPALPFLNAVMPHASELAAGAQLLVTMGCGESCPVVPGLRRQDWNLQDPKGQPIERVRAIRDQIHERVKQLIAAEGWRRTTE